MLNSYVLDDWDVKLDLIPDRHKDVFLRKGYYDVFVEKEKARPEAFVLETAENLIVFPYFKRRLGDHIPYTQYAEFFDLTSAYGYGGVAVRKDDPALLKQFFEIFKQHCRDNKIVSCFTRINPLLNNDWLSCFQNPRKINQCVFVDTEKPIDQLNKEFKHSVRKSVRKARQANVSVKAYEAIPADEFCGIYNETMKRNQAKAYYYFSEAFFQSIEERVAGGFVTYVAYLDGQPISTELVLKSENYWHSFLGGTLAEHMKTCANTLIKYRILEDASQSNARVFLIGGGKEPGDKIFKYKSTFAPNSSVLFFIDCMVTNEDVYIDLIREWETHHPEKVGKTKLFQRYATI
jgi:serine/alanine adding enzyme